MDFNNYYKLMQSSQVIMSYKGTASSKLLDSIISASQAKLDEIEHKKSVHRKVVGILIEILQNIYHHFNKTSIVPYLEDDSSIMFIFAKTNEEYIITAGNHVLKTEIEPIRSRIDEVNNMDADQLKAKYREILESGEFSDKGGAGLGIIDIAKKSGSKLGYEFIDYNEQLSYFSLIVKISAI